MKTAEKSVEELGLRIEDFRFAITLLKTA